MAMVIARVIVILRVRMLVTITVIVLLIVIVLVRMCVGCSVASSVHSALLCCVRVAAVLPSSSKVVRSLSDVFVHAADSMMSNRLLCGGFAQTNTL